jgi:hypothetical protein
MEDLDVPSFFIDSRDRVPIRCQLTAGEIQGAGASVFVCKGWASLTGNFSPFSQPITVMSYAVA